MQQKSLGLIETQGLAAGIEAADAAVKSANVELVGYELTKGGGWTTIKILGDVGAVKAAVDAARIAAGKVSRVVSTRVIARPSMGLTGLIHNTDTVGDQPPEPPAPPAPTDPPEPPKPLSRRATRRGGASGTTESLEEVQPVEVEPSGTTESLEEVQPVEVEPSGTAESLEEVQPVEVEPSGTTESLEEVQPVEVEPSGTAESLEEVQPVEVEPSGTTESPEEAQPRRGGRFGGDGVSEGSPSEKAKETPSKRRGRSPQNAEPRRKAGRRSTDFSDIF
ncbi:MAG: BMC domain-containing protein [Flavonifractor plautii]